MRISRLEIFLTKLFRIRKKKAFWDELKERLAIDLSGNDKVWESVMGKVSASPKGLNYRKIESLYLKKYITLSKWNQRRYESNTPAAMKEHLNYARFIYEQEKKRQENITDKAKHAASNSGIVLTIFGLVFSLLLNKDIDIQVSQDLTVALCSTILVIMVLSLVLAINVLNFTVYARPSVDALETQNWVVSDFERALLQDFVVCVDHNILVNNKKARTIKKSINLFWIAFIMMILVFIYIFSAWNFKKNIPESKEPQITNLLLYKHIYFEFGKFDISPTAKSQLNELADFLKKNTNKSVYLKGYTDFIGSENDNEELSRKRVAKVKEFLLLNQIASNRIIVNYYGEKEPIDSVHEKVAAGINRRVEYEVK